MRGQNQPGDPRVAMRDSGARGQSLAVRRGMAAHVARAERCRTAARGARADSAVRNSGAWGKSGAVRYEMVMCGQSDPEWWRAGPERSGAVWCGEKRRCVGPEQSGAVRNGGAGGQSRAVWNSDAARAEQCGTVAHGTRMEQCGDKRQRVGPERSGVVCFQLDHVARAERCRTAVRGTRAERCGEKQRRVEPERSGAE